METTQLNYNDWSVTEWSIINDLLTLRLGRFRINAPIDENSASQEFFQAQCFFVRPSKVNFSHFITGTSAVITNITSSPDSGGLKTFRFEFENKSFIEITAQDFSTVRW